MHRQKSAHDEAISILLVEDNPGDARFIRELFRGVEELSERAPTPDRNRLTEQTDSPLPADPTIVHETRLTAGLERLTDSHIDVILLDLNLPDSGGLETVETVRTHVQSIPIVVLTGLRDRNLGVAALRKGAEEYLVKDEINADMLIRSVHHAIERKAHERELVQYQTLIETVSDGVYVVDEESRFVLVNEALESITGYSRDTLLGASATRLLTQPNNETGDEASKSKLAAENQPGKIETELRTADGSSIPVETNVTPLPLGDDRYGQVGVIRNITERKEREHKLERQRNQLAMLNSLNELVHEISHLILESTTRKEIEQLVCEHLANSDAYEFAWIGDVTSDNETVTMRAEAGVNGYLDATTVRVGDDVEGHGPTGKAIRTGEVQVSQNIHRNPTDEPWAERACEHGIGAFAAIPIEYENTLYGVLNISAAKPNTFNQNERTVIARLGEVIGHAINAIERKQALISEEVVELRFQVRNVLGAETPHAGTITFDRTIPLGENKFLQYGTVTHEAMETLAAFVSEFPHYRDVTLDDPEADVSRFEVQLSGPPAISSVAAIGGRIESVAIEKGDINIVAQIPPGANVRRVVDAVKAEYPRAEILANRRTTRTTERAQRLDQIIHERLTDKQRAALETAYFAGFFEWPRNKSGEDVATSMGVAASTFHEHIRTSQRKLLRAVFDTDHSHD
ncbi:bacterio-opsin activator domain-containing protein [Haladaptatus sp. DYSN1]|uniref:bacterio-opsin activator domain-containing protein n=2 Tax=Haladaptatus TaxID=367188 RepID=UPI002406ECDC|nr:bacterio-opsin activator domain-containing protein [Haladaptatus sp. DYSN1]